MRIIDAVEGMLILLVMSNVFLQILPNYASTTIGLFLTCLLHYRHFPEIVSKMYGDFAYLWWVRLFLTFYAAPGYLARYFFLEVYFFELSTLDLTVFYFLYLLVGLLFALPISRHYILRDDSPLPKRKFWQIWCQCIGRNATDQWHKVKELPSSSLTRKIEELGWQYLPGMTMILFGVVSFLVFFLLSLASVFFAVILAIWLLAFVWKFKEWSIMTHWKKRPKTKGKILTILSAITSGEKGMYGFLPILISLGLSCSSLYTWIPHLISSVWSIDVYSRPILISVDLLNVLFAVSFVLLSTFQFVFWYAILRRFPDFIDHWRNSSLGLSGGSTPTGGLVCFGLSWFVFTVLYMLYSPLSYENLEYWSFVKAAQSPILWMFLMLVNSFYLVLIINSIRKWNKKEGPKDLHRDNYRIPLAAAISLFSASAIFYMVAIWSALFFTYTCFLAVLAFYIADLRRYLLTTHPCFFKDDEMFDLFLYALFPLVVLPALFLLYQIGIVVFLCGFFFSLFCIGMTVQKRRLRRNKK